MVDLVASNGPFSEKSNLTREEKDWWVEVLGKGGEVVRCCIEVGFDKENDVEPTMAGEWWRYLEKEGNEGKDGGMGAGEWRRERVEEIVEAEMEQQEEKKAALPMRVLRSGKRV
jgi:hypothetical protein